MIDRQQFLKAACPEGTVDIPGEGQVRVRGLTRLETLELQAMPKDVALIERRIMHLGMVDPVLSEDDVEAWQGTAPGGWADLITAEISRLTALGEGAAKSGVPGVREG